MRYGKIGAGCLAAALCLSAVPVPAWAGTPEFAYTAEQWASLRDNRLEFAEIADLIHVYNNTVIQNQLEYEDFRGEDADDIADDYYDAADDIYGSLEYPDSSDSDYASRLSSYLSSQIQADNLREQGDDNVEDGDIKKLEYDKTEAGLVKEAQELMISYWSQTYSLESLEQKKIQAQSSYDQTLTRLSAGMSTQAQVLSAQEAVTSADASLLSAQSSLGQTKENLCLMLGWAYGAQVDIGDVPEPDLEGMAAINLDEDVSRGVEKNYSLNILEKKIANAKSGTNKSSLEQSFKSQKETAASSIKNAYESMMISKSDYEQALNAYEIEAAAMETAERKMAAGTMTRNNYVTQQSSFAAAQVNVRTQKLALLKAQLEYQWSVDGLASVS